MPEVRFERLKEVLFGFIVTLRELYERVKAAVLAGEGRRGFERVKEVLFGFITWLQSWLEKVEYEWATILLGDHNSLLRHDFLFVTCCWLFGLVRVVCSSPEYSMQQSPPFYFFQLFSAMTTALLSALHLFYPHVFAISAAIHTDQTTRHLTFFYVVSLIQALMLLARCYRLRA